MSAAPLRGVVLLASVAALAFGLACAGAHAPLEVADEVDLERYLGRWYEIASFPHRFQKGCVATTAFYSRREDGYIHVENECRDGSLDGEIRGVEGVAWVVDPTQSSAKLKVQFFWPFRGDYWILALDPDYRHAVVGTPDRDYLWILSRTATLDARIYEDLLARVATKGFDVSRLQRTHQPSVAEASP